MLGYRKMTPVMYSDSTGHAPEWWGKFWNSTAGKVTGTILVVAGVIALTILTAGIGTAVTTAIGTGLWASVAGGAVAGAISGVIFGAGISMVTQGVGNGYGNISSAKLGRDIAIGVISGAVLGGAFGALKYATKGGELVANGMSGLKQAQAGVDDAALALKATPLIEKGGSMAARTITQNTLKLAVESLNRAQQIYNISFYAYQALVQGSKIGLNIGLKNALNGWL